MMSDSGRLGVSQSSRTCPEWASWARLSTIQKIALGLWIPTSATVPITACVGGSREL